MKIAYIMHSFDNSNVKKRKELGWFITTNIEKWGCEIEYIEARSPLLALFFKIKSAALNKLGKKTNWFREPFLLKRLARNAEKKLRSSDCQAVFSFGSIPISFIATEKPIIFWTDAAFASLLGRHPHMSGLTEKAVAKGNLIEHDAFKRASRIIFTSGWAADQARDFYKIPDEKIKIATFGPNMAGIPSKEYIDNVIDGRSRKEIHFLWIAVNWELKDGPRALAITNELNKSIKTTLHVVGVPKTVATSDASNAVFYGFLSKDDPAQERRLAELFAKCHFLVHPTKFDTLGQVIIESNSYGLPAITHEVGGVPEVVRHGVNGFIYQPGEAVETIAKEILYVYQDAEAYRALCKNARADYEERTSWGAATKKVVCWINEAIDQSP